MQFQMSLSAWQMYPTAWRRLPLHLLALGLCASLAGCAATPEETLAAQSAQAPTAQDAGAEATPAAPAPPEYADLDGDTLYALVVAELAGRRGRLDMAVKNYMAEAEKHGDAGLAERATRIAVFARDDKGSLEAVRLWARLAPRDAEPAQVLGALLLRANQLDESAAQMARSITLEEDGIEAGYLRVTNLLAREKDRRAAMTVMKKLVDKAPSDGPAALHARFAVAELASRFGELDAANTALRDLLERYPDDERVTEYLARVLQGQKKTDEAKALLESFLERKPESVAARMSYGRLLVGEQRYADAAGQFKKLVEISPDDADARYALAIVLMQLDDFDSAGTHFQTLVDQGQRRFAANYYLGQLAERSDRVDDAIQSYQRVERGEFALNAQIRAAGLIAGQGQIDSARATLHGLRRFYRSESVRLYRAEADLLVRAEDLEGALAVYDQALAEKPKNTDLLYARAMVAARADRVDELERDLRDILSREPNNADALNALGYTLADKTDRYNEALALIDRALKLKPNDHYIIDSKGWVLYRLGRYEEAAAKLREAWALRKDSEVGAHLGEVLWVMGRKDEARTIWDEALETAPDDEGLKDLIKRLTSGS